MIERYRLYRRSNGRWYCEDTQTHRQESLGTSNRADAQALVAAQNQAAAHPVLSMALAKAHLLGRSPELLSRTWAEAIEYLANSYEGATRTRWQRFGNSEPLQRLRSMTLAMTESTDLLRVLNHPKAGSSTNIWLRRLHNYALDMQWLLMPVLTRKGWPPVKHKARCGLTAVEHQRILDAEKNPERRLYYQMLWETGGSQSDIGTLRRENVDTEQGLLSFYRMKLVGKGGEPVQLKIGARLANLLSNLPQEGFLFPKIALEPANWRAAEFRRRCRILGIVDKSLHCYRYAWAERACEYGMPEREAMAHLGHRSPAVHRGYAKKARSITMPLEYYQAQKEQKILEFKTGALPPSKEKVA